MMHKESPVFSPKGPVKNRHFQSIAASFKIRRPLVRMKAGAMIERSIETVLDCGNGARLQGYYSEHPGRSRGLVVFIHGWEGSSDSLYILSSGSHLYNLGFDIFRLNMRDHGTSHHLNRELFHSCRVGEVLEGVKAAKKSFAREEKTFLCGFSLGGNFALRIGARASEHGLHIDRIAAICPVIHPPATLHALENGLFIYRHYFIMKWKKSLLTKQALFPEHYDFSDRRIFRNLTEMTRYFVENHTEYPDLDTYLNGYSIAGNVLETLDIPTHIVSSADDPVIPVEGLDTIAKPSSLDIAVTPFGGHCGFVMDLRMRSWIDQKLGELFTRDR
jgi:predicted alpha/beta-fold hydrolase